MRSDGKRDASVSVEVDAPVPTTWALLTDWAAQGEWIPLTTVTVDPSSPAGLGARLVARTGIGPLAIVDTMTVDVWQPPHRCEVAHHGRAVTGRGVFLVEELPAGRSRFTWEELPAAHGLQGRIERLGAPASRWALGVAARKFARLAAKRHRAPCPD
ncbi:MAG TPA: SRPBCC family protein [Mycobacteriales bacterium]|nr:SRPBCC family protein [Mycobacteriales bacterium]HVY08778.1 SRPBCC family protein [Mycobacteriales bacterium]